MKYMKTFFSGERLQEHLSSGNQQFKTTAVSWINIFRGSIKEQENKH